MGSRDVRFQKFVQVHQLVAARVMHQFGIADELASQVAEQMLTELARELGGSKVYIGVVSVRAAHRRARVLALADEGLRVGYIAARLGISEPTVYRILSASAAGRK